MGAQVAIANAIAGQPTERGASPILYAAASPELTGKSAAAAPSALSLAGIVPIRPEPS